LLGPLDLRVLALGTRFLALVVAGQQQDDLLAVGMAEDPQQDVGIGLL
jgi:hypothetical protein